MLLRIFQNVDKVVHFEGFNRCREFEQHILVILLFLITTVLVVFGQSLGAAELIPGVLLPPIGIDWVALFTKNWTDKKKSNSYLLNVSYGSLYHYQWIGEVAWIWLIRIVRLALD